MPELPEVETVVRDLRPLVAGRTIRAVRTGSKKLRVPWQAKWNDVIAGTKIESLHRRGKWIIIQLNHKSRSPRLLVHLGMTGQFTAVPESTDEPDHLHVVFELDRRRELRFRDPRRFGSVEFFTAQDQLEKRFDKIGLGPEPFGVEAAYFRQAVRKSARSLKAILLDQSILAGVGNIYADEACSVSNLHPRRRGTSLTLAEADRLREAVEAVLTKAVSRRGATIRDYVGGSGLRGGMQHEFRVYGRTGDPCLTCAAPIECIRLSGRSSHYCPRCQAFTTKAQRSHKGAQSQS